MHFTIEVGAKLRLIPELDYDQTWASYREQIREALTVRVPATPDSEGYENCLMTAEVGAFPNYKCIETPRGFLKPLTTALDGKGDTYTVLYTTECEDLGEWGWPIALRPDQQKAVQQILKHKEGVIVAPPASGKTVLLLEAIRRSHRNALIIVDKKNLVDQWKDRCQEFLKVRPTVFEPGSGGRTGPVVSKITIAMQQTLHRIVNPSIDRYGFVCLDECHHVSAETYLEVLQRFSAEYRIGLSATPYRNDGLELISKMVIGPVIYSIDEEELQRMKHILKPKINRIETHFAHPFWSTHSVTNNMICDKPGCPKNGKAHYHRNNYMAVTKALVEDYDRNYFIAHRIALQKDNCVLVVSDRLAHLATLREMAIEKGFPADRTHMLTGKETPAERAEVSRIAGYGSCAIFSTIAKEALDIPRLDRLHLAWPVKKTHILEQQIGRITRTHPDKRDALVLDYVDDGCSVLVAQAFDRLKYYKSKNYEIN